MNEKEKKEYDIYAIISLIAGITSMFIYFISILIPITAIIFAIISLSQKKNKMAIAGLILGCLFTFQYINTNYLLPYLKENIQNGSSNSSYIRANTVIKKAQENGFECKEYICTKSEFTETNIEEKYEINIEGEYIDCYFEMQGDGLHYHAKSRYGYNNGVIISALVEEGSTMFADYRANKQTGERTCNGKSELKNCMFNISITNDLVDYFNNMML